MYKRQILTDWVKQGGTLIAHNGSVRALTSEEGVGNVKQIQNSFDKSNNFNIDLQREIYALSDEIDYESVLGNKLIQKFLIHGKHQRKNYHKRN